MGNQNGHDFLLYLFVLGLLIVIVFGIVTSSIILPSFDIFMESSGASSYKITFTGIAEIIVAIAFGIGIVWKLTQK